jgi:hypothetical protein
VLSSDMHDCKPKDPVQIKLYHVHSLQSPGPKWKLVSEQPITRSEAAALVAAQWNMGRKARAIPITQ